MDDAKLRAWWFHRQGLDSRGCGEGEIASTLSRYGWARSVGGASPYLGFFARSGARRAAVDAALERLEIHELPSARGCTHVVPAEDYALALLSGASFGDGEKKVAYKLGVTDAEIAKLKKAVVAALESSSGPLDPDGLKDALGSKVRNLGEEGKKKGLTTTLSLALGDLQSEGQIRRIPTNGRLDQQRYRYALWRPSPLAGSHAGEVTADLARRYFDWIGPATPAEFQWFSGLGAKAVKAAIASLKLVDIGIAGRLLPESLLETWRKFEPPKEPSYALIGSIDSMVLLRRDLSLLLAGMDMSGICGLVDLPSPAILDRGRIIGLWEYDPEAQEIAWATFPKVGAVSKSGLKSAVSRMEEFVRTDLGDARAFSLDSPKSRKPRIDALRKGF